ncbi:hypothetical protein [Ornithinibacillus californiensis]|uniref:hypothetical protein n=1 Tax=Ornithinibacillus californiensis TaxID=161536 RepID=UPI00064D8C9F|nr:hypothetical protein [Ornithinibacillus californiensis]
MSNKNVNWKQISITSLVVIISLSFIFYSQWTSRTNMYIKSNSTLVDHLVSLKLDIQYYMDEDDFDPKRLNKAYVHSKAILNQSSIYELYYRNQLGKDLTDNFRSIFATPYIEPDNPDKEILQNKLQDLEFIIQAISSGEMEIKYASRHSLIPSNPFTKERMEDVLEVTETIVNSNNEF